MKQVSWTCELPPTGAASDGLEDYEARSADGEHVGVVVGVVRERRSCSCWSMRARCAVHPPALVVQLSPDRAGLDEARLAVRWKDVAEVDHAAALALDPKKTMHGPGAEAVRAQLPAALAQPVAPGVGPAERDSAIALAALAVAAPSSLFAIVAAWIDRIANSRTCSRR